jgi:hypothetical protein
VLSGKPTASSLAFMWDQPAENGAEILSHNAHIWLAQSLTAPPLMALPRHLVSETSRYSIPPIAGASKLMM